MEVLILNNDLKRLLLHCELAFARLYQPTTTIGVDNGYFFISITSYDAKMTFRCRITELWGIEYQDLQVSSRSLTKKQPLNLVSLLDGNYTTFMFTQQSQDLYELEVRQSNTTIYNEKHAVAFDVPIAQFLETHCYAFVFNVFELKEYCKGVMCQNISLRLRGSQKDDYYKFMVSTDGAVDDISFPIDSRIRQFASIDDEIELCPIVRIKKTQLIALCDHMGNMHAALHIFPHYTVWVNSECSFVIFS
jgi:hypothetical protein